MECYKLAISARVNIVEKAIASGNAKDPAFGSSWLLSRYLLVLRQVDYWISEELNPPEPLLDEFQQLCRAICAFGDSSNSVPWFEFEIINSLMESTWNEGKDMEILDFMGKAGIITLCGSTRFYEAFVAANMLLTKRGWTVLSCGSFGHSYHKEVAGECVSLTVKALHFFKILQSDAICAIQPSQRLGKYTKLEIEFAKKHDRTIVQFESTGKHTGRFVMASKNFGFTAKQSVKYATLPQFLMGKEWLDFIAEHPDFC